MANFNAYQLKHKIVIQYDSSDTYSETPIWSDLCTVWAAKKQLTGRIFYQAAAEQAQNDIVFTIRYRTGIKPTMRIVFETDIYEITSEPIDVDDHNHWLEIHAKKVELNGG